MISCFIKASDIAILARAVRTGREFESLDIYTMLCYTLFNP